VRTNEQEQRLNSKLDIETRIIDAETQDFTLRVFVLMQKSS